MSTIAPRRLILACLCVAPLCAALTGCATAASEVKAAFVAKETCPAEQVGIVAAARPDWLKDKAPPPPPPEIAADPARAALYSRQHPSGGDSYAGRRVFLAQGCGHSDLYMCDAPMTCADGRGGFYQCTGCERIEPPGESGEPRVFLQ